MSTPRHILELTRQEQQDFIDSFDIVLCDCDGVFWLVLDLIENSGVPLNLLRQAGKECKFVTNNSLRSDEAYLERFKTVGAEGVQKDDILHPIKAMASYLKKHKPGEKVFSICSAEANKYLLSSGIDAETMAVQGPLKISDVPPLITPKEKMGAVLYDINLDLSYAQLAKAYQYLRQPDCLLISGGLDVRICVTPDLVVQGFVDFLDHLARYSEKKPISLGKPSLALLDIFREVFKIKDEKRCLFIGDSLHQDIFFAHSCGFQTLLVLTGISTKEDMLAAEGLNRPQYYADSIHDLTKLFENIGKN